MNSVPKNTAYKETWALRMFEEFNNSRNEHDVKKKDGPRYPADSLRQLICALFHYFHYKCNKDWNL